jgi:hypothetical protein
MKPVSVLSLAVVTFQVVIFPLAAQEPSIVMKDGGIEFPDGTIQETSAGPRTLTVAVNCSAAESINEALERKADELIVEITGSCHEDVVIERNNVTLRGVMPGAAVVAASSTAIFLDRVSRVSLENLSVQGGVEGPGEIGGAGILVWLSTAVSVSDLVVEQGQSKGMLVLGSTVIISDSAFRNNNGYGLQGVLSSLAFLGSEVDLSDNQYEGLLLSGQSKLASLAAIRANGNGDGGIVLWQNSSASLLGSVEVAGNDVAGIKADTGSVLDLGDVEASENENGLMAIGGGRIHIEDGEANVHENTNSGLTATEGGFFEFHGTVNLNGTDGVYLHGSSATIHDSTIQGNSLSDFVLLFGSRVDFEGANTVGTVVCDETVLVEGDVSCPVPAPAK